MSDVIRLRGVHATACHGVLPHEREIPQPFVVDVDLGVDVTRAGAGDDLGASVSYADVADRIMAVLTGASVDLIETLAVRVADACLAFALVESVEVTVHKPRAPLTCAFDDVAVTVRREREAEAVIALGANLDAPEHRLADAVRRIGALDGVTVRSVSPLVETEPVGGPDGQPAYLNAVLTATTRLAPRTLLDCLHDIEAVHGRARDVRWGPRTLDLDLIDYADERQGGRVRSDDPQLTLPHPRAAQRAFVLVPWLLADPVSTPAREGWSTLSGEPVEATASTHDPATRDVSGRRGTRVTEAQAAARGVRRGPPWPAAVTSAVLVTSW